MGGSSAIFTGLAAFTLQGAPATTAASFNLPNRPKANIIFAWNVTEWSLDRRYIRQVAQEDTVQQTSSGTKSGLLLDLAGPLELTFNQSVNICRRLGGHLPNFPNLTSWQAAYDSLLGSLPGAKLWLPYLKAAVKDNETVTAYYTGARLGPADRLPWRQGEPSRPAASCVRCNRDGCGDTMCSNLASFVCRIPVAAAGRPILRLRGLCPDTSLDTYYYPYVRQRQANDSQSGGSGGDPALFWIGLKGGTYIRFNLEAQVWEAKRAGWLVRAASMAGRKSLLLGTSSWTVQADLDCPGNKTQPMSLVTCSNTEFNCKEGSCIDLQHR